MMDSFLLVGLPYMAVFVCIAGSIYRFRSRRFSYSALSSQFLEDRQLKWGSLPWHVGIIIVLLGHLVAFLIPSVWSSLMSNRVFLLMAETVGFAAAILCLAGICVLAWRRVTKGRIQAVTTSLDLVILGLLGIQIVLGLLTASLHRWGASWSTGTTTPYLWSLLTFRPEVSYAIDLPPLVKAHLTCAWVFFLLIPFSRLVHIFSIPFHYLVRAPQVVVWANPRRFQSAAFHSALNPARRYFLRGSVGLAAGTTLLAVGTVDKLFRFFFGPRMSEEQSAALMRKKLRRLEQAAAEKTLELERMQKSHIRVAKLGDLSPSKGLYFIDYEMRPALAFRDASGLPILISAKCTHLGCTVGSEANAKGQILCPCHVSYFDIRTGAPNDGAPAKEPLPHIPWTLMDASGKVIASRSPGSDVVGGISQEVLDTLDVYIAKSDGGENA